MSRIGRKPITVPSGVEVKIDDKKLKSVYKAYWRDPVSGMRKMYTEGEVMITDESGKKLDMNQLDTTSYLDYLFKL